LGLILPEVDPEPGPRLLLIERSAQLSNHAGQIAFPGGKPEAEDRDLVSTALREASEEVGLDAEHVTVLGRLGEVPTPTGFMIIPFVGRVSPGWEPSITSGEVVRILTPSFTQLADPAIHRVTDVREWRGRSWELHEYAISEPRLWGATANMVWDLMSRMGGS
jgi:8-oxo-dGTP pyrophosphatase MutT (NUDIX family)